MNQDSEPQPATDAARNELARLRRLALHDDLTGLANRRAFLARLRQELSRALRHGQPFSLTLLDLDGLKDLNDTFGHVAGDRALQHFGRALSRTIRSEDLVARIGGDEFAVIGVHGDPTEAPPFIARLEQVAGGIVRKVSPRGQPVHIAASLGAMVWDPSLTDVETVFAQAETALVAAKNGAPAGVVVPSGVYRPRGRRTLGEELRHLLAMAREVSSARELYVLCRDATENAAALIGARQASLALPREDGAAGYREHFVDGEWVTGDGCWYTPGEGPIGHVLRCGEPYVANDLERDDAARDGHADAAGWESCLCLPLRGSGAKTVGVLSLVNKRTGRGFTESDISLGMAFADLVATAIANVNAHEEEAAARGYLQSLMRQAQDAIYIIDPVTRRILDANDAAERLSGYSREELLRLTATELRPPEDRPIPGMSDLIAQRGGPVTSVRRHVRKDQTVFPVEVSARLVDTPRGPVIMQIVRDISDRVEGEAMLRRHNRELEARNQIATILATSDALAEDIARVLAIVIETFEARLAMLLGVDPRSGRVQVLGQRGVTETLRSVLADHRMEEYTGLVGAAIQGRTVSVPDLLAENESDSEPMRMAAIRSLILAPMAVSGQVTGVLGIGAANPHHYDDAQVAAFQALAGQIGLWLEQRRLIEVTRRRERDARFVAELGDAFNRTVDHRQLARRLAAAAGERLAGTILVFLRWPGSRYWRLEALSCRDSRRRRTINARLGTGSSRQPAAGLPSWASALQEPTQLAADDTCIPAGLADVLAEAGLARLLAIPLRAGNRLEGLLIAGTGTGDAAFDDDDVALTGAIARHAAAAMANALSRSALVRRNRELAFMNEINAVAQRATGLAAFRAGLSEHIRGFMPGAVVRLDAVDEPVGPDPWRVATGKRAGLSARQVAVRTRQTVIVRDVATDSSYRPRRDGDPSAGIVLPLVLGDDLVGTLSVYHERRLHEPDIGLLDAAAPQIAAVFSRLLSHERALDMATYARMLFESAGIALLVLDPVSARIIDCNQQALDITGYSREELLGRGIRELGADTPDDVPWPAQPVQAGHTHVDELWRWRRKDGAIITVVLHATAIPSPYGDVVHVSVRDIMASLARREQTTSQAYLLP